MRIKTAPDDFREEVLHLLRRRREAPFRVFPWRRRVTADAIQEAAACGVPLAEIRSVGRKTARAHAQHVSVPLKYDLAYEERGSSLLCNPRHLAPSVERQPPAAPAMTAAEAGCEAAGAIARASPTTSTTNASATGEGVFAEMLVNGASTRPEAFSGIPTRPCRSKRERHSSPPLGKGGDGPARPEPLKQMPTSSA